MLVAERQILLPGINKRNNKEVETNEIFQRKSKRKPNSQEHGHTL